MISLMDLSVAENNNIDEARGKQLIGIKAI
jgi:hypothetical protein